jgi:hypothetical protein
MYLSERENSLCKKDLSEDKEWANLLDTLRIDSVESVLPEQLSMLVRRLHSRKDVLEYSLNDHYSRYFLREVPKVVKRAVKLEPLFIRKPIAERVEIYVREATRAYRHRQLSELRRLLNASAAPDSWRFLK